MRLLSASKPGRHFCWWAQNISLRARPRATRHSSAEKTKTKLLSKGWHMRPGIVAHLARLMR
jgi:hypothetical protein